MTDTRTPRRTPTPLDHAQTQVATAVEAKFGSRVITPRKRRMIDAYVREGTYAAASNASGMAQATCKKLIDTDPTIRDAISSMVEQAALVSGITLERVLNEYARLAFSDVGEVLDVLQAHNDPDEAMAALADLPPDITAAISKVEMTRKIAPDGGFETGTFKLAFYDKKSALTDLGRMLSLFNDKVTITDESGFGDRLKRALAKLEGQTPDGDADNG